MFINILGIFQAVPMEDNLGNTDYYVDGGILCNFPIQAWDGKIILFFNPNCPWIKIWPGLHCFELNSYLQIYHELSSFDFFNSQFTFLGWYLSMRNEDAFINRMLTLRGSFRGKSDLAPEMRKHSAFWW